MHLEYQFNLDVGTLGPCDAAPNRAHSELCVMIRPQNNQCTLGHPHSQITLLSVPYSTSCYRTPCQRVSCPFQPADTGHNYAQWGTIPPPRHQVCIVTFEAEKSHLLCGERFHGNHARFLMYSSRKVTKSHMSRLSKVARGMHKEDAQFLVCFQFAFRLTEQVKGRQQKVNLRMNK